VNALAPLGRRQKGSAQTATVWFFGGNHLLAMRFQGTYTALVTPFRGGHLDEESFAAHIERQIAAGVDGIVPAGTTGESPTLNHDEHIRVIRLAVETARGRCQVIAGTGSNCTAEAIAMTRQAEQAGADGALLVAPYYNKPSQEGLFRHYRAIAGETELPLILYSVPGRCGVEIGVETTRRLAHACPRIVSIKEASGNPDRVSQLRAAVPPEFTILSGSDEVNLPFLSAGANGVISVASNLIPAEIAALVAAFARGKIDIARGLHAEFYPLCKDLFIEPNPVPIKTALHLAGLLPNADVRLPLCEMSPANLRQLRATLERLKLIQP
jgi:4-hydroxy-tetrahydrodipicolinate synthase